MLTVDLLGSTVVRWDCDEVPLTGLGAVLVLILTVVPGNAATSAHIQESAWPDQEPDDKTAARLRSAIRVLRSRFATASPPGDPSARAQAACPPYRATVAGHPGYRLPTVQTDADRFMKLADQARVSLQSGDLRVAWQQARDAARLWRGAPVADAEGRPFAVRYAKRLERTLVAVEITRFESAIRLGMYREIIPDLQALAGSRPGDFGITCMLVTALARCGCPEEAADMCYRALRYAHEYRFDPTQQRQLQYDLLNGKIPLTGPPWSPGMARGS
jgi:DNA-binding SARP family transcriptional activator